MTQQGSIPLIPREILFGNPDKVFVRLSPDGKKISYLAPLDGVMNVWVGPAADPAAAKPVTHDTGRGIRFYDWAYTNDHIAYIQDKDGDENWRIYSVNLDAGDSKCLTLAEGVHARIEKQSPKFPGEVIVALNDRNPEFHDLHLVNIRTGERRLVRENDEGFMGFLIDNDYNVRFASRIPKDGGVEIFKLTEKGERELFTKIRMEDTLTTHPFGFDKTGKVLYMSDSRERDTAGLFAWNPETGERSLLAEDALTDVSGDLMIQPTERTVQAAAFTYIRKQWRIIDESISDDLKYLSSVTDGELGIASRTLDDTCWIVAYFVDNGPWRYYRYDREKKEARFLFTNHKELEDLPLAKMNSVVIKSRDGLNLVCYYTLPVESDGNNSGYPDKPLPMVLLVHGGPWGRDSWGYNSWHQWLANRGYAVLSVNFRGSTGFGKTFINASTLEWGAKMHDDLIDAVNWAIHQGIADSERVAIMGASYGGYATLVGLTSTLETFVCGVDIVGPSNLITLLETIPPYWKPELDLLTTRVGDPRTEEGRAFLTERSPLTYADRIQRPLLIGQGANDPRVKQTESDQIVQAMQEKHIPVTYVVYPDEGHGFARPENRISFSAVAEAFLAKCLGGRYEPVGDDFGGSSITVPVGAEDVPGLTEALANVKEE